jgi:hypothetical protein
VKILYLPSTLIKYRGYSPVHTQDIKLIDSY